MQACTQPPPRHLRHPPLDDWNFRSSGKVSSHWAHNDIVVLASLRKCLPSTKLIQLNTGKYIRERRSKGSRWRRRSCAPLLQNVFQMNALTLPCATLQGQAVILAMAGPVCNLQQRIFKSLVSYAPGFAVPCLTGCSVFFMSLLIVWFQSILGLLELQEVLICTSVNELYSDPWLLRPHGGKKGPTWRSATRWRLAIHSMMVTF